MKIAVTFTKKCPGPEEYSSQGYHLTLETEPPPEVAQDREKLKAYVEELFAECRARVEDQVGTREPAIPAAPPQRSALANGTFSSRRPPGRFASRTAPSQAPRREPGEDGHDGLASPKQLNFVRALGQQAGLSYGQVVALAEETFGVRDLKALTKRQASQLIDQLRSEAA